MSEVNAEVKVVGENKVESGKEESQFLPKMEIMDISIEEIEFDTKWNVRDKIGDVKELVQSIEESGLIHPVTVREATKADNIDFKYIVVAGFRRTKALWEAGYENVPCRVLDDTYSLTDCTEIALTENLQSKSMSPLEEAKQFKALVDELGMSVVAGRLGKSRSFVYGRLQILDYSPAIQDALVTGVLPNISLAAELHRLPVEHQGDFIEKIRTGLSVAKMSEIIQKFLDNLSQENLEEMLEPVPVEETPNDIDEILDDAYIELQGQRRKDLRKLAFDIAKVYCPDLRYDIDTIDLGAWDDLAVKHFLAIMEVIPQSPDELRAEAQRIDDGISPKKADEGEDVMVKLDFHGNTAGKTCKSEQKFILLALRYKPVLESEGGKWSSEALDALKANLYKLTKINHGGKDKKITVKDVGALASKLGISLSTGNLSLEECIAHEKGYTDAVADPNLGLDTDEGTDEETGDTSSEA